jgi:hypothetical protein
MSSILKVDTIQDQSGNNIINESGNVITIGASGDTITVPAGATVSGFTSAGIDDNATSVAITISSDEDVTFTEDILLGDNKKALFGAGSDLQIYHDGSHSFIADEGTGNLTIKSNGAGIELQKGDSEFLARFKTDNAVELYYDNSKKFETTSTGATVTTTLSGANDLNLQTSDANEKITLDMSGTQRFNVNGSEKMRLTTTGLGIGSSTPTQKLFSAVDSTLPIPTSASMGSSTSGVANGIGIHNTNNSAQYSGLTLETKTTNASRWLIANEWKSNFNGDLVFRSRIDGSSSSEILRLKSDGKVGLGTNSPSAELHVKDASSAGTILVEGNVGQISLQDNNGGTDSKIATIRSVTANTVFGTQNDSYGGFSEKMRIEADGDVGIGETAPLGKLHVKTGDSGISSVSGGANELVLEGSGDTGMCIVGGTSSSAQILFGDSGSSFRGSFNYDNASDSLRISTSASERMRIDSSGKVGIGETSMDALLVIKGDSDESTTPSIRLKDGSDSREAWITNTAGDLILSAGGNDNVAHTQLRMLNGNLMTFKTDNTERMRIASNGDAYFNKTSDSFSTTGVGILNTSQVQFVAANQGLLYCNRLSSDGQLAIFFQDNTEEGSINVSGSTVSYNGFTGTHWSRFQDNSTPTILRGTVLETLDEMCDWYNLEFDVITQDDDGNDVTTSEKIPHVLLDSQSDGDVITYNHKGTDYQATITKETDIKHMMS